MYWQMLWKYLSTGKLSILETLTYGSSLSHKQVNSVDFLSTQTLSTQYLFSDLSAGVKANARKPRVLSSVRANMEKTQPTTSDDGSSKRGNNESDYSLAYDFCIRESICWPRDESKMVREGCWKVQPWYGGFVWGRPITFPKTRRWLEISLQFLTKVGLSDAPTWIRLRMRWKID